LEDEKLRHNDVINDNNT